MCIVKPGGGRFNYRMSETWTGGVPARDIVTDEVGRMAQKMSARGGQATAVEVSPAISTGRGCKITSWSSSAAVGDDEAALTQEWPRGIMTLHLRMENKNA